MFKYLAHNGFFYFLVYMCLSFEFYFTMKQFIELLEKHPEVRMTKVSIAHQGNNLYMRAPTILEEVTRSNLSVTLYELMKRIPKDVVHATGFVNADGKKTSCLRKLRVVFRGTADGVSDMDTAVGA